MGVRGAIKAGGGGFLNNQDVEWKGGEFSAVAPKAKKAGQWLYFVPTLQQDGADKEVTQHFFVGDKDEYEVSKDGTELSMADGTPVTFGGKTPFGRLVTTMLDNGLDESELPDIEAVDKKGQAENALHFNDIIGRRMRMVQEVDVEGTKKRGPRVYENAQGKQVETPRTNTVVSVVYPADGGSTKGSTKGKGKAAEADDDDIDETVADYIVEALKSSKSKSLKADDLSMALTKVLIGKKNRDAIKDRGLEESMHETEKGWTYNAKKETLTLDE